MPSPNVIIEMNMTTWSAAMIVNAEEIASSTKPAAPR